MTESRQRGVRLSRTKLTAALHAAGLRTQAALAERIAEHEAQDSAPKNLVSRAFREIPIQFESADRIASALGVPVHSLFLSSGDATLAEGLVRTADAAASVDSTVPSADAAVVAAQSAPARPPGRWAWAGALLVAAAIGVGLTLANSAQMSDEVSPDLAVFRALATGKPTVAVVAMRGARSGGLADILREALAADFRVASSTASLFFAREQSQRTRAALAADVVLEIDAFNSGRRVGVTVFASTESIRRQIWAESAPARRFAQESQAITGRIVASLNHVLGRGRGRGAALSFPEADALVFFLEGRNHLDLAPREIAIRRAQSSFQAALRINEDYARAQAGLCEALLEEYWMNDELRAIRNAQGTCARAFDLAPEDPLVQAARARLLQVTGKNLEAIELCERILDASPDHPEALLSLAVAHNQAYLVSGESSHLKAAMEAARRAAQVDSDNWKPPYRLGSILLSAGSLDDAIAVTKTGVARNENEFILANLGTLYTCAGEFELAEAAYQRADAVSGTTHIDNEMLGQLYYFLQRFDESAQYRRKAINSVASGRPDIHEMWGGLADALRQQGRTGESIAAYTEALAVVERDIMNGNQRASDEAASAYYYSALSTLPGNKVPTSVLKDVAASLDELEQRQVNAAGFRYLALAFHLQDRQAAAARLVEKAAQRCPGYRRYPDFAPIFDQAGAKPK